MMAPEGLGGAALLFAVGALALSACSASTPIGDPSIQEEPLPAPPTTVPPSIAGNLTASSMPEPHQLGPGWEYRVEGADLEDGAGNDTPFQQRDPLEVVETTIPMGCEQRQASSTPLNVLQATYRKPASGHFAVVLRMSFPTPDEAVRFAAERANDLATCKDQPDDPYSGEPAPVQQVAKTGGRVSASYVLPGEEITWATIAAVDGTDLVTLDTDADPGSLRWTPTPR